MRAHVPLSELPPIPAGLGSLALAALALVGGIWLALAVRHRLDGLSRELRVARALRAEREAALLLETNGYVLRGRQVRRTWSVLAEAHEVEFTLIADYLVERNGQRWVAEVKTGERSLDLRHGPTRRQMLEYRQAFDVDGVLLVDAEGQQITRVRFRERPTLAPRPRLWVFCAGVAAGVWLGGYLAIELSARAAGRAAPALFHDATQ